MPDDVVDVLVVGAGPAGCSCAVWLADYRLRVALVERLPHPCAGLDAYAFPTDALLGAPQRSLAELAAGFRSHVERRDDLDCRCGVEPVAAERAAGRWNVRSSDGRKLTARAVVLATGLVPIRPPEWFDDPELAGPALLDAIGLTLGRRQLAGRRVLLLGGGDNAAENALELHAIGAEVTLAARHALRVQRRFAAALAEEPRIERCIGQPLPRLRRGADGGYLAAWQDEPARRFDAVAVLFGYEPHVPWHVFGGAAEHAPPGVFVAGDASRRLHPSVPTAIGDGAHVAHQVERWLASNPS